MATFIKNMARSLKAAYCLAEDKDMLREKVQLAKNDVETGNTEDKESAKVPDLIVNAEDSSNNGYGICCIAVVFYSCLLLAAVAIGTGYFYMIHLYPDRVPQMAPIF